MMVARLQFLLKSLLTTIAVFFLLASYAFAQQGAGVSISPALIEENLDPGVSKEYSVTIRNLTSNEQTYYLFPRNIEGTDDAGIPQFADEGEETGFEIASWVALETEEITLQPDERGTVSFVLNVPSTASPGSHFGGVFVSVDAPEIERSGAAVGYQVGNIISIRVNGDALLSGSIRQFSTSRYLNGSANVDFSLRTENSGNVLIRPTGPIQITNMLGKEVGNVTMNDSRGGVFPGSVREFDANWIGDTPGFGRYEAIVALSYGEQGAIKTMSSTVSFWILPMNIILPALGALVFLLLVTYIIVRLYIRRALSQAGYRPAGTVRRRRRKGAPTSLLLIVVMLCVSALFMVALLVLFA